MKNYLSLLLLMVTLFGCSSQKKVPDVQIGPYTVSVIADNVYHIQDFNDANPAGEQFNEQGEKTHFNNCSDMYLLVGKEKALLIDLSNNIQWADDAKESLQSLVAERIGDKQLVITFTHNHGDHTGMLPAFIDHPEVTFALPRIDFERLAERFPANRMEMYEGGYTFELGDMEVATLLVPGHTPGSMVFFLSDLDFCFTGDAIGSGHGVWLFNEEAFQQYTQAIPALMAYINDPASGIDKSRLQIFGGHYWQRDWLSLAEDEELGWDYLIQMQDLIRRIYEGTAHSESSNLGHPTLDTYFRNGNAIIVWNSQMADALPKTEAKGLKACIFPGDYPDPTILRDGDDYYMTHSNFTYYPGLLIWHSKDLMNWKTVTRAVQSQDYSIFAPELCKVGDKYYIYYPTSGGENFVVTADRIEGPWSEPVKIEVNGIDPGHVVDKDGKRYLYTNNGHVVALTDDGLAVAGENVKVYDGWAYPQQWETEGMWLESPKICRHGDYYYLVSAEGGTAGPPTSHMCVVARSKSALGPWENSPYNPIVHTYSADEVWWSKGHGTLIDDVDGNWYIVYHAYRNGFHTLGRSTIVESVVWTEDGWPVLSNQNGARWENEGMLADEVYQPLRDIIDSQMWTLWEPGFKDNSLWMFTAIDTSYEVKAEFAGAGGVSGLYLFYNEEANIGYESDAEHFHVRIVNDLNKVTIWSSSDGKNWKLVQKDVDVSGYHHNNHQGFFALRPALLLGQGSQMKDFSYQKLP